MWELALGVLLLLALAVGFAIYPWRKRVSKSTEPMDEILANAYELRRDELQEDVEIGWLAPELYGEAEDELDRGLLGDVQQIGEESNESQSTAPRWMAGVVAAVIVVGSLGAFLMSSELMRIVVLKEMPDAETQVELVLERLRAEVEQRPDDATAWANLGDFYRSDGRGAEAVEAWTRVNELLDYGDASALVALADALAVANGDWFSEQAIAYLAQALVLDPNHLEALWLAGWASQQQERTDAAIDYWQRLLAVLPEEETGVRSTVQAWLEQAQGVQTPVSTPSVEVSVTLAPEWEEAFDPAATLFVYATAAEGPPMPLAIWRGQADDLPVQVTLDDSSAMMPQMRLSTATQVIVKARISDSGLAQPQSGDLMGLSDPLAVEAGAKASVVIDQRVP